MPAFVAYSEETKQFWAGEADSLDDFIQSLDTDGDDYEIIDVSGPPANVTAKLGLSD